MMVRDDISVCHVVNAVSTTSVPADIAVGLAKHTSVEPAILAWFRAEDFDKSDRVDVYCLDAPDNAFGVNRRILEQANEILREYDLVQVHHPHSGTFAKIIARYLGKPLVSTEQNTHGGFTMKGLVANGLTNPLADRVTCVSDSVLESLTWWERALLRDGQLSVIYNGVDLDRVRRSENVEWNVYEEADVDPGSFLVGNAAMFTEQKAHATLIRAVSVVDETFDLELVIAGDGPLREAMEALARDEGVEAKVHFLGLLDRQEVYRMMAQVDIYAMPSRWEGFSAAAIEAMSLGTPCVFSDIDEFSKPFGDVALFHPVDDEERLADRLSELATDEERRNTLAARARERAENYSIENIAKEYAALYRELL